MLAVGRRAAGAICLFLLLAGCIGFGATPDGHPDPGDVDIVATDAVDDVRNATVTEVTDGDTVDVRYPNGTTDTVRLLGIDTPEVHVENDPSDFEGVPDTDDGAACLRQAGETAGSALRDRVAGERVRLVVDATADRRDPYGRLLAYVVQDGTDLNRWLVADGHARVYPTEFARADAYAAAESAARNESAGVWSCRSPAQAALAPLPEPSSARH